MKVNAQLEKVLNQIKTYPSVIAIYLFGSFAKGSQNPISDIDIAVIIEEKDRDAETEIGCLYSDYFDVVLFHKLPLYIQFEVFSSGRELFVRDEGRLQEIKEKVLMDYLENSWLYRRIESEVLG